MGTYSVHRIPRVEWEVSYFYLRDSTFDGRGIPILYSYNLYGIWRDPNVFPLKSNIV